MPTKKTTPAPVAAGNEGQSSKNHRGTERPKLYHLFAYYDAGKPVTKCRKRLARNASTTPPANALSCPLCDAAHALESVIW